MGFLRNIFSKKEDEISVEDIEKVENLVSNKENNSNDDSGVYIDHSSLDNCDVENKLDQNPIDFEFEISKIRLDQINKIRNLLDKREIQLTNNIDSKKLDENIGDDNFSNNNNNNIIDISNEVLVGGSNNNSIGEINIEEKVTEKDLDDKTYEKNLSDDSKNLDEEFIEVKDDEFVEEKIVEPYNVILNKIKNIFGEENIFFEKDKKSSYENLNYKNLFFIGIRKLDDFNNKQSHWAEQNSWFVSNIKKLEELKQFKVLESKEGFKDLLFDIDNNNSIILSFRSTNLLKDKNFFNFPINN